MSTLTYNGITISLTRTLGISHEVVRDIDESYLFTRIRIDVEGIVNGPPSQSQNSGGPVGVNSTVNLTPISDTVRELRHALLQERGFLVYNVGDSPTPMITSPGFNGDGGLLPCDANNGPVPGPLYITRVDSIRAFHIRYTVTTCLIECPGYGGSGGPTALISNRYSQTHSIDGSTFLTAITTSGQAFFRTDLLENAGQVADHYRDVLLPPVPLGFKRLAIQIQATPSRNALTYTCTDQERFFDMGNTGPTGSNSNITDVDASYSVSSTGQGGAPVSLLTAHSVRIQIQGSKAASTWTLVKTAFLVAQSKLPIGDPSKGFLTQIAVTVALTGRSVNLQATMMLNQQAVGVIPGLNVDGLRADNTFANQGGLNPPFPTRGGTAGTYTNELLTTAWKSACQGATKPYEGAVASANFIVDYSGNTGPIVTTSISPELPTYQPAYSPATSTLAFTNYKIDMVLATKSNVMQVAVTGPVTSSSSGSGSGGSSGDGSSGDGSSGDGSSGNGSGEEEPPDDCEFLTLAKPTQRRIVEWSAERVGASPLIPKPYPLDPNLRLIEEPHIQVAEPTLTTDGTTLVFSARGRYVYGLRKNRKLTAPLPYPAAPWQNKLFGDLALTTEFFRDGIIDNVVSGNTPTPTPTPTDPGDGGGGDDPETPTPTPTPTPNPTPTPTATLT